MRIERLDYQGQLAQRRYEQVDPSHRLVAATLEQRWNQALEEAQRLKDDYQKYRQQQGLELSAKQQAELLAMAEDLPGDPHRLRRFKVEIVADAASVLGDLGQGRPVGAAVVT